MTASDGNLHALQILTPNLSAGNLFGPESTASRPQGAPGGKLNMKFSGGKLNMPAGKSGSCLNVPKDGKGGEYRSVPPRLRECGTSTTGLNPIYGVHSANNLPESVTAVAVSGCRQPSRNASEVTAEDAQSVRTSSARVQSGTSGREHNTSSSCNRAYTMRTTASASNSQTVLCTMYARLLIIRARKNRSGMDGPI